jgi:hypothetical protein
MARNGVCPFLMKGYLLTYLIWMSIKDFGPLSRTWELNLEFERRKKHSMLYV